MAAKRAAIGHSLERVFILRRRHRARTIVVRKLFLGGFAAIDARTISAAYLQIVQREADAPVTGLVVSKRRHRGARHLTGPDIFGHGDLVALRVDHAGARLGPGRDEFAARDIVTGVLLFLAVPERRAETGEELLVLRLALSPLGVAALENGTAQRLVVRMPLRLLIEQQRALIDRLAARCARPRREQHRERQDADRRADGTHGLGSPRVKSRMYLRFRITSVIMSRVASWLGRTSCAVMSSSLSTTFSSRARDSLTLCLSAMSSASLPVSMLALPRFARSGSFHSASVNSPFASARSVRASLTPEDFASTRTSDTASQTWRPSRERDSAFSTCAGERSLVSQITSSPAPAAARAAAATASSSIHLRMGRVGTSPQPGMRTCRCSCSSANARTWSIQRAARSATSSACARSSGSCGSTASSNSRFAISTASC